MHPGVCGLACVHGCGGHAAAARRAWQAPLTPIASLTCPHAACPAACRYCWASWPTSCARWCTRAQMPAAAAQVARPLAQQAARAARGPVTGQRAAAWVLVLVGEVLQARQHIHPTSTHTWYVWCSQPWWPSAVLHGASVGCGCCPGCLPPHVPHALCAVLLAPQEWREFCVSAKSHIKTIIRAASQLAPQQGLAMAGSCVQVWRAGRATMLGGNTGASDALGSAQGSRPAHCMH